MLPVHRIALFHGSKFCTVLPALYHLTGADYTSKIGTKKSAVNPSPEKYLYDFAQGKLNLSKIL